MKDYPTADVAPSTAAGGFPRIIHQCWKDGRIPDAVARCVESVRRLNPAWEWKLHVDADGADLAAATGLLEREEFRSIPSGIERADVLRCAALYLHGGVYCDLDVESIRGFDEIVRRAEREGLLSPETELLVTTDHPVHCERLYGGEIMYMNHIMIARPRARFMAIVLKMVRERVRCGWPGGLDPVGSTGPGLFTSLVADAGTPESVGISVMPSHWFHPFPDMSRDFPERQHYEELILGARWRSLLEPMAVHYWWHSYCNAGCTFDYYGDLLHEDRRADDPGTAAKGR